MIKYSYYKVLNNEESNIKLKDIIYNKTKEPLVVSHSLGIGASEKIRDIIKDAYECLIFDYEGDIYIRISSNGKHYCPKDFLEYSNIDNFYALKNNTKNNVFKYEYINDFNSLFVQSLQDIFQENNEIQEKTLSQIINLSEDERMGINSLKIEDKKHSFVTISKKIINNKFNYVVEEHTNNKTNVYNKKENKFYKTNLIDGFSQLIEGFEDYCFSSLEEGIITYCQRYSIINEYLNI